jgi:hypothetical protein
VSDHTITIIDRDVHPDEAESLAQSIVDWLVESEIVERELTDCVLGGSGKGHRPARNFMRVTGQPEDPKVSNMNHAEFHRWVTNGLQITLGRHMTVSGEGSYEVAICPECSAGQEVFDEAWNQAGTEWIETGIGLLACEDCGRSTNVSDWGHREPIGFGALSLQFWNWPPPFADEFLDEIRRRLGHRIIVMNTSI